MSSLDSVIKLVDTYAFDENTVSTFTVFTPDAGHRFVVVSFFLHFVGANTITFESGATDISGAIARGAGADLQVMANGPDPVLKGRAAGEAFEVQLASAAQVAGWFNIYQVMQP